MTSEIDNSQANPLWSPVSAGSWVGHDNSVFTDTLPPDRGRGRTRQARRSGQRTAPRIEQTPSERERQDKMLDRVFLWVTLVTASAAGAAAIGFVVTAL